MKMRGLAFGFVFSIGLMVGGIGGATATDVVSVEEILEDPAGLAGEVTVRGELVGDYGFRSDGWVWSQLDDDSYAFDPILEGGALTGANVGIGVRLPEELTTDLGKPGGYRSRGPLVLLTGAWKFHDPDRGGESYLEVASLTVIEAGRPLQEDVHWPRIVIGVALLAAAGALWATRARDA